MVKGMIIMQKMINAIAIDPNSFQPMTLDITTELPSQCPHCKIAYAELPITSHYLVPDESNRRDNIFMFSLFFCPHCNSCFMVEYFVSDSYVATIVHTYPQPDFIAETKFSNAISTLSPQFVEIYNQSLKAELSGLNELCGMVYRKALEFLVKDFSAHIHPDKISEIESSLLGKCISQYIDNKKIQTLATASAWIGNDETHYVRKHQSYNTQDLKRFINTMIAFIEYELNYEEAASFLSNPQ